MKVCVIGQGYVGQSVAYSAALNGHHVFGFDTNIELVNELKSGVTHVPGIDKEKLLILLRNENYIPTNNSATLNYAQVIIIAVPTPLDSNRNPDLNFLRSAVNTIAEHINPNGDILIVNESTSYPGTLRNVVMPLINDKTGVRNFFAASPERVDPGNIYWDIRNTPRLVAGIDDQSTEKAIEFYSSFCDSIYRVSSPEIAEAAKIFENTFRLVNIALANEFSEIASRLGFSATEAITAAATKPFGFMPFFPSIGVGGHCIPVDPTYLSFVVKDNGGVANLIELANKINLEMAAKVVYRIEAYYGESIRGKKIQVAGIAYKANVPDLREAPALRLIEHLKKCGAIVSWHDPLVKTHEGTDSSPMDPKIDLGLVVTPHNDIDFKVWKDAQIKVLDLSPGALNFGWSKFL
jgi:UDP-N-acetyl-D-glucosamine dehydrogenase